MRKIGANYIFLPGFPLMKNGYLLWDSCRVEDLVDTGECVREIHGLEFYGGMIVPGYVAGEKEFLVPGKDLLSALEKLYHEKGGNYSGLAVVEGADLTCFRCLPATRVSILIEHRELHKRCNGR